MRKASRTERHAGKSERPARTPVDDFLEFLARQIAREHLRRHAAGEQNQPNEAAAKPLAPEGPDAD